jgi:hypothetical protein
MARTAVLLLLRNVLNSSCAGPALESESRVEMVVTVAENAMAQVMAGS